MTELLAPAGDMDKLRAAIEFGADAVYLGGIHFGLRKGSRNFTPQEMQSAVHLVHAAGKRIYVTMNIVPHDADLTGIEDEIAFLSKIGVDAVIVSDPGILMEVRQRSDLAIHYSTQGSITNARTANFWHAQGVSRIVLARELTLEEIRFIRRETPSTLELEVFCHGAMCMSYSGRCLISSYMTGRDANRGDCAHPCRYRYALVEEKRPGEYFPIDEDAHGSYLMNSKDLCTLSFLDQIVDAGVCSLKIEGRVKSAHYVAAVVYAYRRALEDLQQGKSPFFADPECMRMVSSVANRPFTSGFFFGQPGADAQFPKDSVTPSAMCYVADIVGYDEESGRVSIRLKNAVEEGDLVEILSPSGVDRQMIRDLRDASGAPVLRANVPQAIYTYRSSRPIGIAGFMRKEVSS